MINKMVLPVVCLLVGGAGGYGLRFVTESGTKEHVSGAPGGATSSAESRAPSGVSAPQGSSAAAATSAAQPSATTAALPLGELMKDLLADYDMRSAQKATAKLSAADLQAALALTASLPKSTQRDSLRGQLYRAWAAINPDAAWQAALADPLDKNSGMMLAAVAGEVAKKNPQTGIGLALSLGMGGMRSKVMSAVFDEWGRKDVVAAIAYANAHPELPMDYMVTFTSGLSRLAGSDPLRAANAAITVKSSLGSSTALSTVLNTWVERDPNAALSWAKSLNGSGQQKDAIAAVIAAWIKVDPAAALAQVQGIPDADTRASALKKGWTDWFRNDPVNAMSYIAAPENSALLEGMGYMIGIMADGFSPQERAKLLTQLPEGKAREDAQRSMIEMQVRKGQFNQALAMLNGMPESVNRDRSVHKLGEDWAKSDLKAAEAWLKLQPDSSDRDLAVAGYTAVLARTNPQAAIDWLETVPDPEVRRGALRNIATQWMRSDAAAAEAWIAEQSVFSDSDKQMIQSMSKIGTRSDLIPSMAPKVSSRR